MRSCGRSSRMSSSTKRPLPHDRSSRSGRGRGHAWFGSPNDRQLDGQAGPATSLTFELQPATRSLDPLDEALKTRTRRRGGAADPVVDDLETN